MRIKPLNQTLLLLLFFMVLVSCQHKAPTDLIEGEVVVDILFEAEEEKLPSSVMVDDAYFEETKHVFFINQDYTKTYSELVEYDTESMEVIQVLDEIKGENGIINEYDIGDGKLVWTTILKDENIIKISYHDITTNKTTEISNEITYDELGLFFTLVSVDGNYISWIHHDIEAKQSKIVLYNTESQQREIVKSVNFVEENFKVPLFFATVEDGRLFYDLNENGVANLYMKNLEYESPPEQLAVNIDPILHFAGDFDPEHQELILYAATDSKDVLYSYDLKDKSTKIVASFDENSLLFKDKIWINDKRVYHSVQQNISGPIADHYVAEVYDLTTFASVKFRGYFSVFKSDDYYGTLKFENGANKIRFELIEDAV